MNMWNYNIDPERLINKVIKDIDITKDQIKISCEDGSEYLFYHEQDCCESVYIIGEEGDLRSLVGQKLIMVDIEKGSLDDIDYEPYDSYTLTNIVFKTDKNTVISRWIGESNGYYSESVDLREITKPIS